MSVTVITTPNYTFCDKTNFITKTDIGMNFQLVSTGTLSPLHRDFGIDKLPHHHPILSDK